MASTYRPLPPLPDARGAYLPLTALAFDPVSDTLWAGTGAGAVVARYGARGAQGVAFPVSRADAGAGAMPVSHLAAGDAHVRALGAGGEGVGQWTKGGLNRWFHRAPVPTTAFAHGAGAANSAQPLCVALATPELLVLNGLTGAVLRRAPTPSRTEHLLHAHAVLLSGAADGQLRAHDPRTGMRREGGAEAAAHAHVAGVRGLAVAGNYACTIGWGLRRSRPFPDPMVKVFDLRQLRPLAPVPFSTGPAFLGAMPGAAPRVVVTSHEGLVNIVDVTDPASTEFYQLATQYVTSAAVSPTGGYLAFGDADGLIHLLSDAKEDEEPPPLNGFEGQPIQWADKAPPLPEIEWDNKTPLNLVGMPHYSAPLLSSWADSFVPTGQALAPAPAKVPVAVLAGAGMKLVGGVAYGALPKELRGRRNVAAPPKKAEARFRSGKMQRRESENDALHVESTIPKCYRKLEIAYSKFGVEDFDFEFYNKSPYSGLESHIANCYVNPVLQALHYLAPVRALAKAHIVTDCPAERCLLCELGFVARNLEDAHGVNCHAGNFCSTLGLLAQAHGMPDLLDYGRDSAEKNYAQLIQQCARFLLDRLVAEGDAGLANPRLVPADGAHAHSPPAPPITQLAGIPLRTVTGCALCGAAKERPALAHVVDLIYPRAPGPSFATVLRDSLVREITHKATCGACRRPAPFFSRRAFSARALPPVLAVHACVANEEQLAVWRDSRKATFLSPEVTIRGHSEAPVEADEADEVTYEIRAIVVQIVTEKESHLVGIINVPEAELDRPGASPWYVFNDFGVRNVSEKEALSFPDSWKVPAIVYLERTDMRGQLDFSMLPTHVDASILRRDTNIARNRDPGLLRHEYLSEDEMPRPGTIVAIDAEFVLMQQEETDFRSDGSKKVLRPARLSLARVSVLRGGEHKQGVPFIDDHIHTSELVVDYLTEFSGIKFGDLDPHLSRHTLSPLKTVYKKLRLLVDRGCFFVGHGLKKDFRMINIFVPPDNVFDTVDIYFVQARHRRLSLRFLSWFVLDEQIQAHARDGHDSIEDALAALRLWLAFQRFEAEGVWVRKLEEIYREGKQYNYKPPVVEGPAADPEPPTQMVPASPVPSPVPQQTMQAMSPFAFGPTTPFSSPHQFAAPFAARGVPAGYFSPPAPSSAFSSMPTTPFSPQTGAFGPAAAFGARAGGAAHVPGAPMGMLPAELLLEAMRMGQQGAHPMMAAGFQAGMGAYPSAHAMFSPPAPHAHQDQGGPNSRGGFHSQNWRSRR